jgi:D-glycero-D-manno-heptose 1,7-bisphosphate phosphatase
MKKLVVLDRDGVINHDSDDYIKSVDEWLPIDGSAEAIARLTQSGFTVTVATNQSGIGRCLLSVADLDAIHAGMRQHIEMAGGRIDKIVFCPHLPEAGCDCRKPKPGLLTQLQKHYDIGMHGVPFIGDSERDLRAARAAGARPILVLTGNGRKTLAAIDRSVDPVEVFDDLSCAVEELLRESDRTSRA